MSRSRMRRPLPAMAAALLTIAAPSLEVQPVLAASSRDRVEELSSVLSGGGFEEGEGDDASGWQRTHRYPPARSSAESRSGRHAMHVRLVNEGAQPGEGGMSQTVHSGVLGGEEYVLTLWVKEVTFGAGYAQQCFVEWLDANGRGLGGRGLTEFRSGGKDWKRVQIGGLVAPAEATGVRLFFRFLTGAVQGGAGEVYLDDVSLAPVTSAPAEISPESGPVLVWSNGDWLRGELLPSEGSRVRWLSPLFADPIDIESQALDSIFFPKSSVTATERFRVETTSGDVFTADLVGSDDGTLHLSCARHGEIRVRRDAVRSFEREALSRLVFDGSRWSAWDPDPQGPLRNLIYRVYRMEEAWGAPFPDPAKTTPTDQGRLPAGHLDIHLSRFKDRFAVLFEGQLEIEETGDYVFDVSLVDDRARLSIDGELLVEASALEETDRDGRASEKRLTAGLHVLQLEFIDYGGSARLGVGMRRADSLEWTPLTPTGDTRWRPGPRGQPTTDRASATIFRPLDLPERFEIDLHLASTGMPRFVLALGQDLQKTPKIVTWDDELVVVDEREDLFEPLVTMAEGSREVRLRVDFDGPNGVLEVFDANDRRLVNVSGIRPPAEETGLLLRNRGRDLAVRHLRVYRRSRAVTRDPGPGDSSRPRVHLVDGSVVHGRLVVTADGTRVEAEDGSSRSIALDEVLSVARPTVRTAPPEGAAELGWADGAIVRGRLAGVGAGRVTLRTAFSEEPVSCSLAGASSLRFAPPPAGSPKPERGADQVFLATGRLRGWLAFDLPGTPLSWRPEGVSTAVRFASPDGARVEREGIPVAGRPALDTEIYPSRVHLRSGEVLPCRVVSCDGDTLALRSPFLAGREVPAPQVRAIEFARPEASSESRRLLSGRNARWRETDRLALEPVFGIEADRLDRALTVPRFRRAHPPSHILVARSGDLRRGRLVGIAGEAVAFESGLREVTVPVARLAAVVAVSAAEEDPDGAGAAPPGGDATTVRAILADGSVLVFEPLRSEDGRLLGRSPIYGDVTIPTASIRRLSFGVSGSDELELPYRDWIVHPASEPEYGEEP